VGKIIGKPGERKTTTHVRDRMVKVRNDGGEKGSSLEGEYIE